MKINIAVVDDHNLYRKGIISLLSRFSEINEILEFEDGKEYINFLSETPNNENHIALVDYQMPHINGDEVCNWLKTNRSQIKSIVISQYKDQYTIKKFISNGANGYLLKDTTIEELHSAILQVHQNNFYFNDHFPKKQIIDLVHKNIVNPTFIDNEDLTEREKEIAKLICHEFSYKEIAKQLDISTRTVETHKNNILDKIGATKVTGIVVYATKKGWI